MFKNIKSLFLLPEEEQKEKSAEIKSADQSLNQENLKIQPVTQAVVDNSILEKLLQALEDNNQPGFDYFEFRKALLTLSALQMDEAIKFQSTFATAATMGVTLEKLIDSIEFYKKVLLNEKDNFTKAVKEQTSINIDDKLVEMDKINATIKEKSSKIQKLTEEIQLHQAEILQITNTIEASESKIKQSSMNFEATLNILKSQLEQDSIKLKQYLK